MEWKAKVICSIVGFLGLLAAALGFAAQSMRTQRPWYYFTPPSNCAFQRTPNFALGLIAAGALLVAQIIVSTATGCFCYRHRSISKRILAGFCFVISWITFVSAFFMFVDGATHYASKTRHWHTHDTCFYNPNTYFAKPWVFISAALLSLVTVALGIVSYLALDSAKINDNPWGGTAAAAPPNQGGIAMAQPQFPSDNPWAAPSNKAVFVHEDTYMRQQYS